VINDVNTNIIDSSWGRGRRRRRGLTQAPTLTPTTTGDKKRTQRQKH